jgi:hypothetical protein
MNGMKKQLHKFVDNHPWQSKSTKVQRLKGKALSTEAKL